MTRVDAAPPLEEHRELRSSNDLHLLRRRRGDRDRRRRGDVRFGRFGGDRLARELQQRVALAPQQLDDRAPRRRSLTGHGDDREGERALAELVEPLRHEGRGALVRERRQRPKRREGQPGVRPIRIRPGRPRREPFADRHHPAHEREAAREPSRFGTTVLGRESLEETSQGSRVERVADVEPPRDGRLADVDALGFLLDGPIHHRIRRRGPGGLEARIGRRQRGQLLGDLGESTVVRVGVLVAGPLSLGHDRQYRLLRAREIGHRHDARQGGQGRVDLQRRVPTKHCLLARGGDGGLERVEQDLVELPDRGVVAGPGTQTAFRNLSTVALGRSESLRISTILLARRPLQELKVLDGLSGKGLKSDHETGRIALGSVVGRVDPWADATRAHRVAVCAFGVATPHGARSKTRTSQGAKRRRRSWIRL